MVKEKIFLAEVLKREIKSRDITLTQLSEETMISKSTLHGWCSGAIPNGRNLHLLCRLCEYFKMNLDEMLFNRRNQTCQDRVIFSSEFSDDGATYRFVVEKICNDKK